MYSFKLKLGLAIFLFSFQTSIAQKTADSSPIEAIIASPNSPTSPNLNIKPLEIGDLVPNYKITNIKNFNSQSLLLNTLRGKLVIIDFWNQWCAACIEGMPKMQKLKEKFGDNIEIFLVTEQSPKELERLFKNSTILKSTTLPFVLSDTIFHQLFPHKANPYHIWIGSDGIVKATTAAWNTNEKNISDYFAGKQLNMEMRKDAMDFNLSASFLKEGNGRLIDNISFYSLLIPQKIAETAKAMASSYTDSLSGKLNGMRFLNYRILDLYAQAYNLPPNDKIIVETPDGSNFYEPVNIEERNNWAKNNVVSYEFKVPSEYYGYDRLNQWMQEDLSKYIGLVGKFEKRKMKCWIIHRTTTTDLLKTKGGEPLAEFSTDGLIIKNNSIQVISNALNTHFIYGPDFPIVIDSTGYEGNIDISLPLKSQHPNDRKDLATLNKYLLKYGITINEEILDISTLILYSKNSEK